MKISILLPYKENFSPNYAGAVSLHVKDTSNKSQFKKKICVFGSTTFKNTFNISYKNIILSKNILSSSTKNYLSKFNDYEKKRSSDIIEIHNRPNYIRDIQKNSDAKIVIYFHNDPLSMQGSKSVEERLFIIKSCSKIIVISEWVKKRLIRDLNLNIIDLEKIIVIHHSTNKPKTINFKNKKKWIIFVGKLNKAKGYDLFGQSIIKILNKYPEWKGLVIGDEPREKHFFQHKNLIKHGFIKHSKTLNIFKKCSIAVVCSRWDEPFGRTSIEASSRGCAVILSDKGGLPETTNCGIRLKNLNSNDLYKEIEKLIINNDKRKKIQKKSFKKFILTHEIITKKIDNYRNEIFLKMSGNSILKTDKSLKVLHVANFNEKHDGRLFFVSVAHKLSNGLIRLGHSVLNYSDRYVMRISKTAFNFSAQSKLNENLLNTIKNYNPDLLLLGHADLINNNTLLEAKKIIPNLKISQWFEDPLISKGPDYEKNKKKVLDKITSIDSAFITTSPDVLKFKVNKKKVHYLPIPVDSSIESLKIFEKTDYKNDVFFAMSHGVNRGVLKSGKTDDREIFLNKLVQKNPNIVFDFYGLKGKQPVWANDFFNILPKSKMALNLSRGSPIKYYSSNRIASLIGNGIFTLIDKKTQLNDFFSKDELILYNNIDDLSKKIKFYSENDSLRKKIAKKGWKKYHSKFNSTVVAKYIVNKTFNIHGKKFHWEK
tara:strand:- start:680 stop:2812 length:2133 start_codon:yes stop_codon:yes gene_type:complete